MAWRCLISTRQFPPPSAAATWRLPQPGAGEKSVCPGRHAVPMLPDNINQWYVRNASGTMARFLPTRLPNGPMVHRDWNATRHPVNGDFRWSGGREKYRWRMKFMADLVAKLPAGVGYSWTDYRIRKRYPQIRLLRCMRFTGRGVPRPRRTLWELVNSVLVMLVVPLGVVGALLATDLRA